jgi:pyruvate carboxylase
LGLKNNIALHEVIMRDEKFRSGIYTTKYLEETKPQSRVNVKMDLKDEKFVGELIAVATAHLG